MTRRKVFLIALITVVLVGGVLGGIQIVQAMQGGDPNTNMTKSVARVTYNNDEICTGSVVGNGWILTALHCDYDSKGNQLDWRKLRVQLWQEGMNQSQKYEASLDREPIPMPGAYTKGNADYRDVMLLHVNVNDKNNIMPSWVKTIPMALQWPNGGTTLTEYGYGILDYVKGQKPTQATSLNKSKPGSITRHACPTRSGYQWTNGHICTSVNPDSSLPWPGDSGGPLLWWVNGYWQQVGTFSLFPRSGDPKKGGVWDTDRNWRSYWSEADGDTRDWILSYVLSELSPDHMSAYKFTTNSKSHSVDPLVGKILRDQASGMSWLYESDGYRRWISDGGTYNCLRSNGAQVLNLPLRTIEALPDMKDHWASCTPRPSPTSPPASTVTPITHTPPTVTPVPPHPPTVTPVPPQRHAINAYDNYGQSNLAGHAMCRGNPDNPLSMPGGTGTQTFTVPSGVASLSSAKVQVDPASVTAHMSLAVNGSVKATATATAVGDTKFSFGPVPVHAGDVITLKITFTATYGKIITLYTVGNPGGKFTASNSCPDGAPNFSTTSSGLRAVVSGMS